MEKNKKECLTKDDIAAKELVEKLGSPKDSFSQVLSKHFIDKYGKKLLDDLANGYKDCKYELTLKSNLTFESAGSTLHATAQTPKPIILQPRYQNGDIFLEGSGPMKEQLQVSGDCSYPIQQYDELSLGIERLNPIF